MKISKDNFYQAFTGMRGKGLFPTVYDVTGLVQESDTTLEVYALTPSGKARAEDAETAMYEILTQCIQSSSYDYCTISEDEDYYSDWLDEPFCVGPIRLLITFNQKITLV